MLARLSSILALGFAVLMSTPTDSAKAQFCQTASPGWRNAASGTAGCVPLLPVPGGGAPTGILAANDDGSSPTINLAAAFPGGLNFFGGPFVDVVVNNNGNVTFGGTLFTYTPTPFPLGGGPFDPEYPMIAPYWGDVDTRGGGAPANNYVWWYLESGRMIVTWDNVGYFNQHDDRKMSFQMILTNAVGCAEGNFDVEFRYNRCEWTTGDASSGSGGFGGTPAQVGFDANDGTNYVSVPNSLTMAILDMCTTSNVGMPGIWRFSVSDGMVACPDAGDVCDTGMLGACGIGITQCIASSVSCVGVGTSSPERCDGIDNDCDGMVDGEGLCDAPNVCYQGACIPPCFEGGCESGYTCSSDGVCVDSACVDVTCPSGQRCAGGVCVDGCDGITCPHARTCVAGRCVDVCSVITCGDGYVCQDGECRGECPCVPCGEGETCLADGSCSDPTCDLVTCDAGEYCEGGTCYDSCAGAMCPPGQRCEVGECVDGPPPMPMPDGGVGPGPDTGVPPMGDGAVIPGPDGGTGSPRGRSGCACETAVGASAPTSTSWAFGLLGLLGLLAVRRRR
jgi:MYXO-CTERM domain-containing protein